LSSERKKILGILDRAIIELGGFLSNLVVGNVIAALLVAMLVFYVLIL
jgi:hypothetical protein